MKEKLIAFMLFLGMPLSIAVASCSLIDRSLDQVDVQIVRQDGQKFHMTMDVAQSSREQATGLSKHESIPEDHGMLYVAREDFRSTFSAGSTPFPLDIIMLTRDGEIIFIVENVPAFDETPHGPDRVFRAAIEMNAGTVNRLGIQKGDQVIYPKRYTDPRTPLDFIRKLIPRNNGQESQDP